MGGRLQLAIPLLWLCVCPLIVGIARGSGLMVLRPNEMLLVVLLGLAVITCLPLLMAGRVVLPPWRQTDGAVLVLLLFGTVLPLLIGYGRGTGLTGDDVLYSVVFLKYALLYGLFRFCRPNPSQSHIMIATILASGVVVGLIALLQAKDLLGINSILAAYYDAPFEGSSGTDALRASSTIASSFGLADTMTMSLALALATLGSGAALSRWQRACLVAASLVFAGAILAAGSFTGIIGAAVTVLAVGAMTGRLSQIITLAIPAMGCGAALLWPTISARLDGFSGYRSMPRSWIGRLDNLERFFWPEIFQDWNWLLGVRPAARVAAPEAWRQWVYIESGYTWLLWIGGLPMLLAFLYFMWSIKCDLAPDAIAKPPRPEPFRVAALASSLMILVIMLFDPHLTVRGCADLYFPLLAIALNVKAIPIRSRLPSARHAWPGAAFSMHRTLAR